MIITCKPLLWQLTFAIQIVLNYRGNVTSPEMCLERLKHDKHIDIIMVDVKFPNSNMNGIQLVDEIRRRKKF